MTTLKQLRESCDLSLEDIASVFFRAVAVAPDGQGVVWKPISRQWINTLEELEQTTLTERTKTKLKTLILKVAAENQRHARALELIGAQVAALDLDLNATRAQLARRPVVWKGEKSR